MQELIHDVKNSHHSYKKNFKTIDLTIHIASFKSINHRDKNHKIIDHIADEYNIEFPATFLSYCFHMSKYIFKTNTFVDNIGPNP